MFYKLESLRGVFACLIILTHTPYMLKEGGLFITPTLALFVDAFFILSGFVLSLAYEDRIIAGFSFQQYFKLRFTRVYPLHFFTLVLWLFYLLLKQSLGLYVEFFASNEIRSFISNLFLIHALGLHGEDLWNYPSWSISVEFYTYLLFYISFFIYDKKRSLYIPMLFVIIGYSTLFYIGKPRIIYYDIDYGIIRCISGFYFGVFLYRLKNKFQFNLKNNITFFEVLSILLIIVLFILTQKSSFVLDILIIISLGFLILIYSEKNSGCLGKILSLKILKTIGLYSFSIYMMHTFVISLFTLFTKYILNKNSTEFSGIQSAVLNLLIITITIVVSKYTYYHIENRFRIKSKKHIRSN